MKKFTLGYFPALVFAAVMFFTTASYAHDLIVKPEITKAAEGEAFKGSVYITHTYIQPEFLPNHETTKLKAILKNGVAELPVTVDEEGKRLVLNFISPTSETFIIGGGLFREGVFGKQQEGVKQPVRRSQNLPKTIVNLSAQDEGYAIRTGEALEIVPLANPAELKGGELPVQVFYEGKPVKVTVNASYDGYKNEPNAFTATVETDENGIAKIPLTNSGLWVIRTSYGYDAEGQSFDIYSASANLVFELK